MRLEEGRGASDIDARVTVTGKMCSLLWCHIGVASRCHFVVLSLDLLLAN